MKLTDRIKTRDAVLEVLEKGGKNAKSKGRNHPYSRRATLTYTMGSKKIYIDSQFIKQLMDESNAIFGGSG